MTQDELRGDPFVELKRLHKDYKVFDAHYESVGNVDDIFVDADEQVRYIGIKTGLLGTHFILVPVEIIRVNDKRHLVEVSDSREKVEHAPSFEDDREVTPEIEDSIRTYFGLESLRSPSAQDSRGNHGEDHDHREGGRIPLDDERVDLVPGEREESSGSSPSLSGGDTDERHIPTPEQEEPPRRADEEALLHNSSRDSSTGDGSPRDGRSRDGRLDQGDSSGDGGSRESGVSGKLRRLSR